MGDSVTERIFRLLGAFSAERPELTLKELADRTGLPVPTVHRLGGELVALGALEREPRGPFRIGLKLWEVASLAPRSLGLREHAMPFLEDLFEVTRENIQLAVLDGREAVYIERLSARGAVSVVSRVGGRLPLHATAVGHVLLANAPTELQEAMLAERLPRLTPKTIIDAGHLRRVLAEIRRSGVAICDGQVDLKSLSVAAPIRQPSGAVIAAVSVVVPSAKGATPYVPVVRAAARGITRSLATVTGPKDGGPETTENADRPSLPS